MQKLLRYLKPFLIPLMLCVALLFTEAMCDLALPDYMSNIVNYGIQNGGIESSLSEAYTKEGFENIKVILNDDDKAAFEQIYTRVSKDSADEKLIKQYPLLEKEDIYILDNKDNIDTTSLNRSVGISQIILHSIDNPEDIKNQNMVNSKGGLTSLNIPKGVTITPENFSKIISKLPADTMEDMRSKIYKQFDGTEDTSINQIATEYVKGQYIALGEDLNNVQRDYILNVGFIMLIITLISAVCTVAVGLLAARIAAGVAKNLRTDVFTKTENFSNAEFNKFSVSSLITRTTNDITQVQSVLVMSIRLMFYAPIMGVGGVIRAIGKSVSMSWIIALAVILLLGFIATMFTLAMPKFKLVQKLTDKLNLVSREGLSGMLVIRAFGNEKFEEKRFDGVNHDLTDTNLFVNRAMAMMMPFMGIVMNGVSILIIWVGARQIEASAMQVGDMMAYMQYATQIIMSFLMMSMIFILVPRASVSAQRISEVLETDYTILDPDDPQDFNQGKKGVVEFKDMSFAYPGASEYVLRDINFTANPGETTAIIGSTGSGKSTLVQLIPRLFDASKGEILVDGENIQNVNQKTLRERIGFVPQKGVLFKGTIRSNLLYGDDSATDSDLYTALDVAQAKSFVIDEKENGLDTEIVSGGTNVSGGQRQRLSIARALVRNPEIYIFDDSFSALDYKTDKKLRKELKNYTEDATVIIVAQRISTIATAEKIIVLDDGKIVGSGTHEELLKDNKVYREIALSQLSEEEVAEHVRK